MSCLISKALFQAPQRMQRSLHSATNIPIPVQIFNLKDIGVEKDAFLSEHKPIFHNLKPDVYDARQEQLQFLMSRFKTEICNQALIDYYTEGKPHSCFETFVKHLTEKDLKAFYAIKPFRYRALSSYEMTKINDDWNIKRVLNKPFSQKEAKKGEAGALDFRQFERHIPELETKYSELSTFQQTLKGVCRLLESYFPKIERVDLNSHHIKVVTTKNRNTSNSPEGIHQDGFPFIVSALVVERHAITGGESEIFLDDKVTKIAKTSLKPGQGILQADLGSDLWHHVTAIKPTDEEGFRSSLGFDIRIVK